MDNQKVRAATEQEIDAKIKAISKKIQKTTPIERAVAFNEMLKKKQLQKPKIAAIFNTFFGES